MRGRRAEFNTHEFEWMEWTWIPVLTRPLTSWGPSGELLNLSEPQFP